MRAVILFCLVAGSMAVPGLWLSEREGRCPTQLDEQIIRDADRCSYINGVEPWDYNCDRQGQETYKCCQYGSRKVCVAPVLDDEPVVQGQVPMKTQDEIKEALEKTKDFIRKVDLYSAPKQRLRTTISPDTIRWCVSSPCQKTKCRRMVNELTYNPNMVPRKEWRCIEATSQEQCMFWIEQGWADIMTTREEQVYSANTTFNLKPIAYETTINDQQPENEMSKYYQNVTFVLKSSRLVSPNTYSELRDKTTCHAGIDMPASFADPVCNLITEGVIPVTGNYIESFSDFVQESCLPGVLNKTFDKNGTYPHTLVSLCEDQQREYSGIQGALKCLNSGKGQVTFVDQKVIKRIMDDQNVRDNYMVVCRDESRPLDEDIFDDASCHVGHTARPALVISKNNTLQKETDIKTLVRKLMEIYGNTDRSVKFNIFDSSVYDCGRCQRSGKPLNKNLIFLEESNRIEILDDEKVFAGHVFTAYNTCSSLVPKPRAKICVTNETEYEACRRFKGIAENVAQVKDIAWGCVLANSNMECMKAVHNNSADLFKADPQETFIAGKEFLLDPLMSVHRNDSVTRNHTFTRTLAVIKSSSLTKFPDLLTVPEGQPKYIKDLFKLKICSAGLKNFSAFSNPIGYLLANGTIPRIGSVFESVNRYFQSSCIPDIEPERFRLDSDLLIGHELNWGFSTLNMYNFTGQEWLLWNTPATWNFLTYNRKVSIGLDIKKLLELKRQNLTSHILNKNLTASKVELLDDLIGVEGLSDLVKGLQDDIRPEGKERLSVIRERLSNSFPNFEGVRTLSDKVDMMNKMQENRQNRIQNKDTPFADFIQGKFRGELMVDVFSKLLELRGDKIATLEEIISHVKTIPYLTDFKDKEITSVIKHPAIMSYVEVYFPRLSQTFVEPFDNVELREREFNRYTNPLWLSPMIDTYLEIVRKHMTEITKTCNSNLPLKFNGYEGSLRCLKSGVADLAFFDEQTLRNQDLLSRVGFTYNDLRLLCPNGQVVEIDANLDVAKVCNFGEVQNPVLVTAYNTSGSWRWRITKALMNAHHSVALPALFGEGTLMGKDYDMLLPIAPLNQSYQPYLGPKPLRSMEAMIKPSSYDWFKDQPGICYGETYTNIVKQRNGTCQAIVKDVTCVGTPRMKKISVGRFGAKQYKLIKMCSRPSKFVRKMADFQCDNGYGFLKPVVTAIACECMPCEEILEYNASFTQDKIWKQESNKYHLKGDQDIYSQVPIWGNYSYFYNHSLNKNFELGNHSIVVEHVREVVVENPTPGVISQINTEVDPETRVQMDISDITKTCESIWTGQSWLPERFANSKTTGSCVIPERGRTLRSRVDRFREIMQRQREQEMYDQWN
ncbi:major yolk protein-like [Lytechinus pictus]|uniref:major yolk protein-like n=1 Tax=Lytechinus pictus TaxID=7653 RepID=UPI0030B9F8C8